MDKYITIIFSNSSQNDEIQLSDHQNAESASQVINNKLAVGIKFRFLFSFHQSSGFCFVYTFYLTIKLVVTN